MVSKLRILLLSAYDAVSHRHWHRWLVDCLPEFDWTVLTLPDRHFAWRISGNAIGFAQQYNQQLTANYDIVLATSMVDLSALFGFFPHLSKAQSLLYFHENQMAYPPALTEQNKPPAQRASLYHQLDSIKSAMVAKHLIFNSNYNRQTFLNGVDGFFKKMPDFRPKNLATEFKQKSQIIAVPIAADCVPKQQKQPNQTLQIVWNHRWEYDKAPQTLLHLIQQMKQSGNPQNIKFHIIGQQFRTTPESLQQIEQQHQDLCLNFGYIAERNKYIEILQAADVVLSTAIHEFQGLAVMEAVACGCVPLVPDRLAYREYYPKANRYRSTPQQPSQEAATIAEILPKLKPQQINLPNQQAIKQAYRQILSSAFSTHW